MVPTVTSIPTSTPPPTPIIRPTLSVPDTPGELVELVEDAIVRVRAGSAGGSGFIFDTEGDTAFVVTNHHVIEDSGTYDVVVGNATT